MIKETLSEDLFDYQTEQIMNAWNHVTMCYDKVLLSRETYDGLAIMDNRNWLMCALDELKDVL